VKELSIEQLLRNFKDLNPQRIFKEVELNTRVINKDGIMHLLAYGIRGPNKDAILKGAHTFVLGSTSGAGPNEEQANYLLLQLDYCEFNLGTLIDNPSKYETNFDDIFQGQTVRIAIIQLCDGLQGIRPSFYASK